MSTGDLSKEISGVVPSADLLRSAGAAGLPNTGLPDAATVAKLANEFFRALPGAEAGLSEQALSNAANSLTGANSTGLANSAGAANSTGAFPAVQSLTLTEDQLGSLPATLTAAAAQAESSAKSPALSVASFPEIPGGLSSSQFSQIPSFSFLQEARSLVSNPVPASIAKLPSASTLKIPYETELRDLPGSFAGAKTPSIPGSAVDFASPQIPGASSRDFDPARFGSFNFLQEANPIDRNIGQSDSSKISSEIGGSRFSDLSSVPFDVAAIRRDFPILQEKINGRQLVWLDNAATTQKPQSVIDRLSYFYAHENSNIHRAAHTLAARATDAYEAAREKVRRFLNAPSTREIIFVRGATEAINLVASSWGRRNIQKDDEIVITWLEHHANIVPWQMLCAEKGAKLRVAPVDNSGQVLLDEYEKLLNSRTKLVAFAHVSNALGTITPVEEMIAAAHRHGAKVLVDGAQAISHLRVDVQAYDCDFYVFSGHKVFAPTGIGVVYGKADVLESMPPYQGGGNMITDVTFEKSQFQSPPGRFEAGTGSIGDAVGLGAAIDYLERIGMVNITRYEHDLLVYATEAMQRIPGLHLIGTAREKASVLSFVLDGYPTEEVGAALNQEGIAVRSGHHCAQPILRRFGLEATVRPSLALYNTCEDVDALINAIWNLKSGRRTSVA